MKPSADTRRSERLFAAQEILGHTFEDIDLLDRALTHPSYYEDCSLACDYERLEFLGDSVLGLIVVEDTYRRFPEMPEGMMTKIKIATVSGSTLSAAAGELGLGNLLLLGESERRTGGRGMASALENVFEATVGALYLDGGIKAARAFVLRVLGPHIAPGVADLSEHPKSRLQEVVQARGAVPEYEIVSTQGPPHDRTFCAVVTVDGETIGRGTGRSKKEAEMNAAADALSAGG